MAANRGDSFAGALSRVWARGGVLGCELLEYWRRLHTTNILTSTTLQTIKVLFPGHGSKPQPRVLSFSSLPQKPNSMRNPSAPRISLGASLAVWLAVWLKHMRQWDFAPA